MYYFKISKQRPQHISLKFPKSGNSALYFRNSIFLLKFEKFRQSDKLIIGLHAYRKSHAFILFAYDIYKK